MIFQEWLLEHETLFSRRYDHVLISAKSETSEFDIFRLDIYHCIITQK